MDKAMFENDFEKQIDMSLARIDSLSIQEIDDLHSILENGYARLIMKTPAGTQTRREIIKRAYQKLYVVLNTRRRINNHPIDTFGYTKNSFKLIATFLKPRGRIFDIGCGTGVLVDQSLEKGFDAFGIDCAEELISLGRKHIEEKYKEIKTPRLFCGDFFSEDLESLGKFDLIHSNDVLEHIPPDEADAFIKKCHTMLAETGVFWVTTPNQYTVPAGNRGLHLHEYSLRELVKLLERNGFPVVMAQLWGNGRFRKGTGFSRRNTTVKEFAEIGLSRVPLPIRRKILFAMSIATVVAMKQ